MERGGIYGCDLDDWFQAEKELTEKLQRYRESVADFAQNHKGCRGGSMRLSDLKTIRPKILPIDRPSLTSRLRSLRRGRSNSPTVVLTLALGIFVSGCNRDQATTAMPVPEVEVATVETRDVQVYTEWVATLDGYVNAQIRPQVS